MKGNQTNEVITDKNIKSNNSEVISNKQIEEMAKVIEGAITETVQYKYAPANSIEARLEAEALYNADYRKERQGEWIDKPTGAYGRMQSWCSACGKHSGIGGIESNRHKPFCPNCGARMKGE